MSEKEMILLATKDPKKLVELMKDMVHTDLTFAAEHLALCGNQELIKATLLPLLGHESALVREGAVYGLHNTLDEEVTKVLEVLLESDTNPGVRWAISETLYN